MQKLTAQELGELRNKGLIIQASVHIPTTYEVAARTLKPGESLLITVSEVEAWKGTQTLKIRLNKHLNYTNGANAVSDKQFTIKTIGNELLLIKL